MSLSPSAKLLLSQHPEEIKEFFNLALQLVSDRTIKDSVWTDFVQKHTEPNRDWEIVFYKHNKSGCLITPSDMSSWSESEVIERGNHTIHSVRRLSDNEVFVLGDTVEYIGGEYGKWIIQNFFLKDKGVLARSEGNTYCEFVHDKKFVKSKPGLFKTESELSSKDIIILLEKILCSLKEK